MRMGFAVPVSGSWATPENQVHIARRAERLGYDSLWTFQRLLFPAEPDSARWKQAYRSVQDPLVTLAYLAGQTSGIRLGVALLNMPFFSPALMVKQLTSLDIVSGGRLEVGLGIGWAKEEYAASGVPYRQRGRRAEEFLHAVRALWSDDIVAFHGDFYEIPPAHMAPKPVQQPHPPILVGGGSEPALRRAGRLAQGWVSGSNADLHRLAESIETVKSGAREVGRDPEALRFVSRGVVRIRPRGDEDRPPLTGSVAQIRQDLDDLRNQGVTELFVDPNFDPEIGSPDVDPAQAMRLAEQQLEAFAP